MPEVVISAAAVLGPDDVWVGGTVSDGYAKLGTPAAALLAHYDGSSWRTYRFPSDMPNIIGISALGPADVWMDVSGGAEPYGVGLISTYANDLLHWNGSSLRSIPAPRTVYATDVVGESAHSAWITGLTNAISSQPGAAYWNGTRWTTVPDPALATSAWQSASGYGEVLTSVISDGHGGLWAAAEPYPPGLPAGAGPASLWHYANGRWTGVRLSALGYLTIYQLAEAPGRDGHASVWAVGTDMSQKPPNPTVGIVLRYTG